MCAGSEREGRNRQRSFFLVSHLSLLPFSFSLSFFFLLFCIFTSFAFLFPTAISLLFPSIQPPSFSLSVCLLSQLFPSFFLLSNRLPSLYIRLSLLPSFSVRFTFKEIAHLPRPLHGHLPRSPPLHVHRYRPDRIFFFP
jgi:hypothetical protein